MNPSLKKNMTSKTETLLEVIKNLRAALAPISLGDGGPKEEYRPEVGQVGTALGAVLLSYLKENIPTLEAYAKDPLISSLNNLEFEFLEIGGEDEGEAYREWWLSRPDAPKPK